MFIHTLYLSSYSARDPLSGSMEVKDETSSTRIKIPSEVVATITTILEKVFSDHQDHLVAKISAPLETHLLPAPEVFEEADFSEVTF